jgi:2-polyprenyl-3-methyl-5-hydroxy-6-metoxy-1,4-benzoquinol methylase
MGLFKEGYNSKYFTTWIDRLQLEKLFDAHKIKLIKYIKPSGKLFEIGCGTGKLLNKLKSDYEVSGMDISPSAILFAKKSTGLKNLKVFNIEKENFLGKYDIIIAFDVLEHLKNPSLVLEKIKKALKQNGVLIFSVPNNYGLFGSLMTKFFNFIDKTHISTYPRDKWIRIMKEKGFKIEEQNQHTLGISKAKIAKHYSFNLVIIAKINK